MALTVATNTGALMAQAAASSVNKEMEMAMERLSTGNVSTQLPTTRLA